MAPDAVVALASVVAAVGEAPVTDASRAAKSFALVPEVLVVVVTRRAGGRQAEHRLELGDAGDGGVDAHAAALRRWPAAASSSSS